MEPDKLGQLSGIEIFKHIREDSLGLFTLGLLSPRETEKAFFEILINRF